MAISIIASPEELNFSKNSLSYSLQSSSTAQTIDIGIEVHIETFLDSNAFELAFTGSAPVDQDKKSTWELSDIISNHLAFEFPDLLQTAKMEITTNVVRWFIKTVEIEDGIEGIKTTLPTKTTILGGLSQLDIQNMPIDYFFMTTRPTERILHINQKDWLYVMPVASGTNDLIATIIYTDGSSGIKTIPIGIYQALRPFYVPIDFGNQNYTAINPAKQIKQINFQLGTGEIIKAKIDSSPFLYTETIVYGNSYGGIDTLYATGKMEENQETTVLISIMGHGQEEADTFNSSATESILIRSGLKLKEEITGLLDMRIINKIQMQLNEELIKVYNQPGSWTWRNDDDFLFSAEFNFIKSTSKTTHKRA